jgi:hypothetical protein
MKSNKKSNKPVLRETLNPHIVKKPDNKMGAIVIYYEI